MYKNAHIKSARHYSSVKICALARMLYGRYSGYKDPCQSVKADSSDESL